jgi:hypothetical protein
LVGSAAGGAATLVCLLEGLNVILQVGVLLLELLELSGEGGELSLDGLIWVDGISHIFVFVGLSTE